MGKHYGKPRHECQQASEIDESRARQEFLRYQPKPLRACQHTQANNDKRRAGQSSEEDGCFHICRAFPKSRDGVLAVPAEETPLVFWSGQRTGIYILCRPDPENVLPSRSLLAITGKCGMV